MELYVKLISEITGCDTLTTQGNPDHLAYIAISHKRGRVRGNTEILIQYGDCSGKNCTGVRLIKTAGGTRLVGIGRLFASVLAVNT